MKFATKGWKARRIVSKAPFRPPAARISPPPSVPTSTFSRSTELSKRHQQFKLLTHNCPPPATHTMLTTRRLAPLPVSAALGAPALQSDKDMWQQRSLA